MCKWCNLEYPLFGKESVFLEKRWLECSELCFDCRIRNLLLWRNEKNLYWRKSDKTGKKIMSIYHPEYKWQIYDSPEWDLECWFPSIYTNFDEKKDFLQDYYELMEKIPKSWTDLFLQNENIWFCNRVWRVKNSYYSFACIRDCEDIYFSYNIWRSSDIYNSSKILSSNLIYDSVLINKSYQIFFSDRIENCKSIYFSFELTDSEECLFCSNLVGKKYMIYNKQYKEEEYKKIKNNLIWNMASNKWLEWLIKEFEIVKKKAIRKWTKNIWSEKVIWNDIINSNETIYWFWLENNTDSINSANWFSLHSTSNVFNSYWFWEVESMHLSIWNWPWSNIYFSVNIVESSDIYYSQKLTWCQNCIWCFWLQNASYHILNKPYSKEEYNDIFPKIISNIKNFWHYKDFLIPENSPFPINDSCLSNEFQINLLRNVKNYNWWDLEKYLYEEKIIDPNWKWIVYVLYPEKDLSEAIFDLWWKEKITGKWKNKEVDVDIPKWMTKISSDNIPDNIKDIDDSILNTAIKCENSWRY
jgi:hypothetical protein